MMEYFKPYEFKCNCNCGKGYKEMNSAFLTKLDDARYYAGVPFILTSGFRCPEHNKDVGGSVTSSHMKGLAVDIFCPSSSDRFEILQGLMVTGFKRIGLTSTFLHVDADEDKVQNCMWVYKQGVLNNDKNI